MFLWAVQNVGPMSAAQQAGKYERPLNVEMPSQSSTANFVGLMEAASPSSLIRGWRSVYDWKRHKRFDRSQQLHTPADGGGPCAALTNAYTEVKRASDSYLGIPSQCFAANKAKLGDFPGPGREQYLANIAMKVNAKLRGTNVVLSRNPYPWMNEPYMVFGRPPTRTLTTHVLHVYTTACREPHGAIKVC